MFRLILMMLAYLWSAVLDTEGGGGSGNEEGGSEGGGKESFTLTAEELTNRTNKAAEDRASELAGVLGVDLSNTADVKALIEAGRKAQEAEQNAGSSGASGQSEGGGNGGASGSNEGGDITGQFRSLLNEALSPITERLGKVEGTEEERQQQARQKTLVEGLDTALGEANVRDDRMEAARAVALANGVKLNDKGELEGSKEAIAATKKALPEAFRGDGDTGKAGDANGNKESDRKPRSLQEAVMGHYQSQSK